MVERDDDFIREYREEILRTEALPQEEREETRLVAEELKTKLAEFLGGEKETTRSDPDKTKAPLVIQSKELLASTIYEGAEFGINRITYNYDLPDTTTGTQELWNFYPERTLKTTRNFVTDNSLGLGPTSEVTVEANADELKTLLDALNASVPFTGYLFNNRFKI